MKKNYSTIVALSCIILFGCFSPSLKAQKLHKMKIPITKAFQKGCLLVGISEGNTSSIITTRTMGGITNGSKSEATGSQHPQLVKREFQEGVRDPLIIEYGISNRWGLGLTSGKDLFTIKPQDFYGFSTANNEPIQLATDEFTFDANYHIFVNKRLDLSIFNSIGGFSVSFQGQDGDAAPYKYKANGNMIRVGTKVRYYFFRHLGAFGMVSSYAGHASPKDVKDNTVATNYSTNVSGYAVEMGLCYRFFR